MKLSGGIAAALLAALTAPAGKHSRVIRTAEPASTKAERKRIKRKRQLAKAGRKAARRHA